MKAQLTFHDYKPESLDLQGSVIQGLATAPRSISPKFFYDQHGSELFELICEQPEYYPPAVEQRLLETLATEIADLTGTGHILVEPGAGSTAKVRLLLDQLAPSAYVPMDISFDHLIAAATGLATDYPWLPIHAACVDFTHSLPIPDVVPHGPRLFFFPGSSIGNFERDEAGEFLAMVREAAGARGMLLIGVDTRKDAAILNAAYNDKAGITAQFNLNLLHRMRRELGMQCDPEQFTHRAYYNEDTGRIEMHLVSTARQTLYLNHHQFELAEGETIHTENSYKYDPAEFLALAEANGYYGIRHWQDPEHLFCIYLLAVR